MPKIFHGGAETQFRRFFENIENCYIAALNKSSNRNALELREKYRDRILELNNPYKNVILFQIQTYWNIFKSLYFYYDRFKGYNKLLVIYGAGTKWLILYPIIRAFGYKILYSERNDGVHRFKYLYNIIEKCDIVTTNSIEAKEVIGKYVRKKPIHVINNGIIIPQSQQKKHIAHNPLRVLVPARIHSLKNQKIVIEALMDVLGVEVHFAGAIDDVDYYEVLKGMIVHQNVEKKFLFDGFVNNMSDYYNNFDVVILPSLSEGTPNVLLEGMAYNILCIASDIPMNRRVLRDERFLFEPQYPQSLRQCFTNIRKLSESDKEDVIRNNLEYVKANYSVDKMVQSYYSLIESL